MTTMLATFVALLALSAFLVALVILGRLMVDHHRNSHLKIVLRPPNSTPGVHGADGSLDPSAATHGAVTVPSLGHVGPGSIEQQQRGKREQ